MNDIVDFNRLFTSRYFIRNEIPPAYKGKCWNLWSLTERLIQENNRYLLVGRATQNLTLTI